MQRLTKRASCGNAFLTKVKDTEQEVESKYPNTLKAIMESWDMLAAYEDLNRTPSELAADLAELERLKEWKKDYDNTRLLERRHKHYSQIDERR